MDRFKLFTRAWLWPNFSFPDLFTKELLSFLIFSELPIFTENGQKLKNISIFSGNFWTAWYFLVLFGTCDVKMGLLKQEMADLQPNYHFFC